MANNGDPGNGGNGPTQSHPEGDLQSHAEYDEFVDAASDDAEPLLPLREPLRSIFRVLGTLEQIVGGLLLVQILILVLAQVAQRYIPGAWPWTGELARLSLVWATFLMAGYLIAYAPHHIAIHVVDYVAKGRRLVVVKMFVNLVVLVTSVVLLYGTYVLIAEDIGQVTPAGGIPLRYVNTVPLVGLALVVLRTVLGIVVRDVPDLLGRERETA